MDDFCGRTRLRSAQWLLGFDFDGTLADVTDHHSVPAAFFRTLDTLRAQRPLAWGICTGRSLDFLIEGMENAAFPYWPDYVVTQERDLFYLDPTGAYYQPDEERNAQAYEDLTTLLAQNTRTLQEAETYITTQTTGQWVRLPDDPAGIIATCESEIAHVVSLYDRCPHRTADLDYQRNTIYLRFTHRNYCKGTAITYLQQRFDISHQHTLVMGDNYNDLTMLNHTVAQHYGGPANSIPTLSDALLTTGGFISPSPYAHGVIEALVRIVRL